MSLRVHIYLLCDTQARMWDEFFEALGKGAGDIVWSNRIYGPLGRIVPE